MPSDDDFTPLHIARAAPLAEGIHGYELQRPDAGELPAFTPGAHIEVRVPNGMVRKYSLANDPAERDRYLIVVKREVGGRGGSASLVDHARTGDLLPAHLPPRNDFPLAERAQQYVFLAGGIGITPIMSMVRHLKSAGGPRFKLYYLNRSPAVAAFREELSAPELRGQAMLHYDGGDPARAFDLWTLLERPVPGTHVYCCGPRPLLEAVRDMSGHWSPAAIHFESFVDAAATHTAEDRPFRVRLAQSGEVIEVGKNDTILEALRARGHDVPSSCESGTCGTCRTTLLAGEADHRDFVLTDDEQATNIMVCISRARSDEIVIDR
ncbi:MAG: PDR/VanB family oxidoreductase [Pseudomonadota bacterium]|nr:PDR/VanB family oxidoreductase [Pseudomonadota bacterium]